MTLTLENAPSPPLPIRRGVTFGFHARCGYFETDFLGKPAAEVMKQWFGRPDRKSTKLS